MIFMVLHNRHHKVSQSVPFFMCRKTVTILLRIRAGGHFVMTITKNHESHYVGVLDNPHKRVNAGIMVSPKTNSKESDMIVVKKK